MKKIIMILCLMLVVFVGNSFAMSFDSTDLTETQKAELQMQVARMKENNINPTSTPTKVNEWVKVGENVGYALIGAADKVGIAVEKFSETNVGKITIAIVLWKMMGSAIVHIVVGISLFIITTFILFYFYRRNVCISKVIYTPIENRFWRKKEVIYNNNDDGTGFVYLVSWFITSGISMLITFSSW